MARTQITVESVSRSGLAPTNTTVITDGHKFLNDGQLTVLRIKTAGTGLTLTVQIAKTVDGKTVTNPTYVIGTNAELVIGPFPAEIYNQADGMVYIDYSATPAGASVSVMKVGP